MPPVTSTGPATQAALSPQPPTAAQQHKYMALMEMLTKSYGLPWEAAKQYAEEVLRTPVEAPPAQVPDPNSKLAQMNKHLDIIEALKFAYPQQDHSIGLPGGRRMTNANYPYTPGLAPTNQPVAPR